MHHGWCELGALRMNECGQGSIVTNFSTKPWSERQNVKSPGVNSHSRKSVVGVERGKMGW